MLLQQENMNLMISMIFVDIFGGIDFLWFVALILVLFWNLFGVVFLFFGRSMFYLIISWIVF